MKIVVTGGMGYIGSHTVVELLDQGFEVVILDNLANSKQEVLDKIETITNKRPEFVQIDLCDKELVTKFFSSCKTDALIHFAAHKDVGKSVLFPLDYYRNNLLSLINILEAMSEHKVRNIVFSSSCSVYGEPDALPVSEDTPVKKAESPYANTKQICEEILADYIKTSEIKGIALRYFNPIGAHESALIGELPLGAPTNLVPVITQTAIGKREVLNVFGDDYDTPDGSCIRDYIHVVDLAKAHVTAIERLIGNKFKSDYELFNLGTGRGNTVLEVIHTFEKVSGVKLNYKISPRRPGDVVKVYADTTKANKELGWVAEKSLDEMVSSAWAWEKKLLESEVRT
jgi:UDP-glucose 4-epimerase